VKYERWDRPGGRGLVRGRRRGGVRQCGRIDHHRQDRGAARWPWIVVDEELAVTAAEIASELGSKGPSLSGADAHVAAVGRELDTPVVSDGRAVTHTETKRVIDVDEYRQRSRRPRS
jgi:hypothetical protein